MSRTATMSLFHNNVAHGVKRPADDSLDDEQRFTKRFNLLNIVDPSPANNSNLYIPVDTRTPANLDPSTSDRHQNGIANPIPTAPPTSPSATNPSPADTGMMAVDDTPHRIYIHDLDSELASLPPDTDSNRLIFLPDIDRALSRLPSHLLRNGDGTSGDEEREGKELVLYDAPVQNGDGSKCGQGAGEDSVVRRVLEEAKRHRAERWRRDAAAAAAATAAGARQTWEGEGTERAHGFGGEDWGRATVDDGPGHGVGTGPVQVQDGGVDVEDVDAMDIG